MVRLTIKINFNAHSIQMKLLLIFLSSFILFGCVNATMTKSPNSNYAPIEQSQEKLGTIEYLDNSQIMDSIRIANRNEAYKKMYDACSGKYSILSEKHRVDAEVTQGSLLSLSQVKTQDRYRVIEFQCK